MILLSRENVNQGKEADEKEPPIYNVPTPPPNEPQGEAGNSVVQQSNSYFDIIHDKDYQDDSTQISFVIWLHNNSPIEIIWVQWRTWKLNVSFDVLLLNR